jgi:ABC-2 type transport system permease protein
MKGLLCNDLLGLKKTLTWMLLFLLVYAAVFTPVMGIEFIAGFVCIMSSMMVVTAATTADMVKWDSYALTMPVSRKTLVREKYLMVIVFVLFGTLFSAVFGVVGWFWKHNSDLETIFWICGICACLGFIINSILLPFIFKFGAEKAKFMVILCVGVPVAVFALLAGSGMMPDLSGILQYIWLIPYVVAVVTLLLLAGSYWISMRIYQKKEF